jgi:hypothetical protein
MVEQMSPVSEIQKSEKRKRKKLESHNPFEAHPQ